MPGSLAIAHVSPRPWEDAEREIILHTLAHTQDNVTEAARLLDLERGHFYKKMKALGLRRSAADKEPAPGPSGE